MQTLDSLNPQFVTDAAGRRTAVLLSIDAFEALVEDLFALGNGVPEAEWLRDASRSPVFADLADPAEDLYSADDGVPFRP